MILTDDQKQQAKALGLTFTEMSMALATHIAPETYAKHKQEIQAERGAWEAKMAALDAALVERATHWPAGRWQRPASEPEERD